MIGALTRKGFVRREGDHIYLRQHLGPIPTTVFTMVSHGEREISDSLIARMARQLRLTRKEFLNLIDCTLTQDAYLQQLIAANVVRPDPPQPPTRT